MLGRDKDFAGWEGSLALIAVTVSAALVRRLELLEPQPLVWQFFVSGVNAALDAYQVRVGDRAPQRYDVSGIHGAVDITIPAR